MSGASRWSPVVALLALGASCQDDYVAFKPTGRTRYVTETLDHFWEKPTHFRHHIDCEGSGRLASDVDAFIVGAPVPALAVERATGLVRLIDLAGCTVIGQFVEPGIDVQRVQWSPAAARFSLTSRRGVVVVDTRPEVVARLVAPAPAQTYVIEGPYPEARQGWDPSGTSLEFHSGEQRLRWSEDAGVGPP